MTLLIHRPPDNPAEEPDKIGIEGSMQYLMDLGVKLDEVVVLAILTELAAPTMGEFTREGFVNGWQHHRYALYPKHQNGPDFPPSLTHAPLALPTAPKPCPNNKARSPPSAAPSP